MKIDDILSLDSHKDIIDKLKEKDVDVPIWEKLQKEYEVEKHDVFDTSLREDKVKDGRLEKAARIGLSLEKYATRKMSEFMFAIPVKRNYINVGDDETKKEIVKAIEAIYKRARINTVNSKRSKQLFASCEIFTLWYPVEKQNNYYGFDSKYKLMCKTYSPMDGYELYPLFDEYGDMIAQSVEYKIKSMGKEITIFETFTKDKRIRWRFENGTWEQEKNENIIILKIPCVYAHRKYPIWEGLCHIRSDIEFTVSRNSDMIAYNAAPVLMIQGLLKKENEKGETRRVYQVEKDGDIKYVEWNQSIEAIKHHIDTLLKLYFLQLQLPDLSFENMKGLAAMSGEARKTLLADAHLKVGDEKGDIVEFLEREGNVIKEFLKHLNKSWSSKIDEIDIEHEITPFIQNDEEATINKLFKASGGKPMISQREAIEYLGYSDDIDKTYEEIQEEENMAAERERSFNLFTGAY